MSRNQLDMHNWNLTAKLRQKMSMLGQLFKQIPDIIQMDGNVDGKYEDTERTRWFKFYLGRGVETERSEGNYDSVVPWIKTSMSLWAGSDVEAAGEERVNF